MSSRGLPSDSTCVFEAEPGKLDIFTVSPDIGARSSITSNIIFV